LENNPLEILPNSVADISSLKNLLISNTKLRKLPAAVHKMNLDELDYSGTPYEEESERNPENEIEEVAEEVEAKQGREVNAGCFSTMLLLIVASAGLFYFIFS
jgi:Leucine-rich repeat (LRR) protein